MTARSALEAPRGVADAVLYEGYVLYPYRASAAEEPGALAVGRADAARPSSPSTRASGRRTARQVLVDGGAPPRCA